MPRKILVTYAARHAATASVAEAIGKILASGGQAVTDPIHNFRCHFALGC